MTNTDYLSDEHATFLEALEAHRGFLRTTVVGLNDDQARSHPTASALCLGGIVKHVAATESTWADFIVRGASAFGAFYDQFLDGAAPSSDESWNDEFKMLPDETLSQLLDSYAVVAARTAEIIAATANLGAGHPLPKAPWFEPGASWSARRVLVHLIAETAQHAGHADIIRESIDGAKTMG